jgi:alpha-D-xyloside xylohydrolase
MLGSAILVAPLLDDTGMRQVALPAGANYYDFWNAGAAPLAGGTTISADFSADPQKIPVYFREGAIVPMVVDDDVTQFGDADSRGLLTLVIYPSASSSFMFHEDDDTTTSITATTSGTGFEVDLARAVTATILRVRSESAPTAVTVNGAALGLQPSKLAFDFASTGFFYDAAAKTVWVKIAAGAAQKIVAQ